MTTMLRRITLDGSEFDDWIQIEVTRNGANITADVELLDPSTVIADGTAITIEFGRLVSGVPDWVTFCEGRVVASSHVEKWRGDALRISIDGTSGRLQLPPEERTVIRGKMLRELLRDVYVKELGFIDFYTNVRDYLIDEFTAEITQSWHAAVVSLISGFSPKTYFLVDGRVIVYDTKRPIPPGFPATPFDLGDTEELAREYPPPQHVNVVLIEHYTDARATDAPRAFRDVLVPLGTVGNPRGFAHSKTLKKERRFFDPAKPDEILERVPIGIKKTDFDAAGDLIAETETENTLRANTSLIERSVVKKSSRVPFPGGDSQVLLLREERKYHWHDYDAEKGEWTERAVWGRVEGEVLEPDLVPLDEGGRDGLVRQNGGQTSRWMDIEHSHKALLESGPEVQRVTTVWDDLHGGIDTQIEDSYPGTATTKETERETTVYRYVDQASIDNPAIGLKPALQFDGKPYGLLISKEIVDSHIFHGWAADPPQGSATLFTPDPTRHEGELYRVTTRQGDAGYWMVDSVTYADHRAEKLTSTKLNFVKVREA